ncbi:translation elongation factor Ts, mitochondrial [Guillardia theta CCMP2712]|uniref:Elongation factor Ts, mitochondrial n=2 Tax=Guillardia theta TaxID=55529 RepID=L1IZA9_GUITC|nr:translation elongation factor Ts, mitochondrial [Guillardia theta CCMP2712]EKX41608.1 translation elongation factor Ts, mitochondrial [Guillardia theta CCMP2712]|eukprot:XP_005828588.1 translation elongation factor Ts, mitochondrial [Guillardia theta CCMP2712]
MLARSMLARCVRARPIVQSVRAAVCAYARADLRAFSTPASLVKELRDKTGSPMMDCKRALEACNGDMTTAMDWLRKKGIASAAKKIGRRSADGLVAVKLQDDKKSGAVVELNSETDFVAKNPIFKKLVEDICLVRLKTKSDMDVEDFKKETVASGPKSTSAVSIDEAVKEMVATVGENCQLRRAQKLEVSEGCIVKYIHTPMGDDVGKLGVLVALESSLSAKDLESFGMELAMHIAAASPKFNTVEDIPQAAIEKESEIFRAQGAESGKPKDVVERMIAGRLKKWHEEVVLHEQDYLIVGQNEKKKKVKDVIESASKTLGKPIKVKGFLRIKCGDESPEKAAE